MAQIHVYHTHIEVYPYTQNECKPLENMFSKAHTARYSPTYYIYEPFGYYIENTTLYIPRGVNLSQLKTWFYEEPTIVSDPDPYATIEKAEPLYPPKSQLQANAIDFLAGEGEFTYTKKYTQLSLNLDTGAGKTYAAICAVLRLGMRAIMITHSDDIRTQWYDTILEKTTMDASQVCKISGSDTVDSIIRGDIQADFYLISHSLINTYARNNGWESIHRLFRNARIGIKIIDEAHKWFSDTFMIDCFTDTAKTFYLTATFMRANDRERRIYDRAFSSAIRFGEKESKDAMRKHTVCIIVYIQSSTAIGYIPAMKNNYGFDIYKYSKYEFEQSDGTLMNTILGLAEKSLEMDGRILIVSPQIDSSNQIYEYLKAHGIDDIGTINSTRASKYTQDVKENCRCISSTTKSLGEGSDIDKIRVVIDAEPIGNKLTIHQLMGRLREYAPDKDTYFYYIVDLTIPRMTVWLKRILPEIKSKAKKIIYVNAEELLRKE